jgi:hypothetical protein
MRFVRTRAILGAGLLAAAGAAAGIVMSAGPAAAGTGVPEQGVSVPNGQLFGVAATSASNAWAVGSDLGGTILQHWNGTVWK